MRSEHLFLSLGRVATHTDLSMQSAINTRMGAQVLVESNAFRNVTHPIMSTDSKEPGYVTSLK